MQYHITAAITITSVYLKCYLSLVLLWLSKLALKPWSFSIEPYRKCGLRLSIDGFGFSVSKWTSTSVLTVS